MAKLIPYKCQPGHVTIIKFNYGEPTTSVVICEPCEKVHENKFRFGSQWNSSIYKWFGKHKPELNSRQQLAYRY